MVASLAGVSNLAILKNPWPRTEVYLERSSTGGGPSQGAAPDSPYHIDKHYLLAISGLSLLQFGRFRKLGDNDHTTRCENYYRSA